MNSLIDYSARRTVWSGLGTDISHCNSIQDALEASNLDFEVRQTDVMTSDFYPIKMEGFKANIKDDGTPLGIVTNKYKVVQNADAFSFLDSLIEDGMKFERAGGLQNGRKVFILGKMPERYIISGESISPYIVFLNSHDGTGSIKVLMTPVRMICLNMLNLAVRKATRSWSAVHSGDIEGKLEDAKNTLMYADMYMQALGSEIESLKHQIISQSTVNEVIETLIPMNNEMTDAQARNARRQREDIMERYLHAPDLMTMQRSAYRLLNAVSDFATHSDPIRRRGNYHEALFARSVEGNPIVDKAYTMLKCAS